MAVEVYDDWNGSQVQSRERAEELEKLAQRAAAAGVTSAREQGVDIADHQSNEHGMVGLAALHAARYALGIYEQADGAEL